MTPHPSLFDTGNQDALEDQSTEQLEHKANSPASEAYVDRKVTRHIGTCWIRRLRIWVAFAAGILVAGQVASVWIVRASLLAARAEMRDEVRKTVNEVLTERKITGALLPDLATGVTLAAEVPNAAQTR